jgi:Serine hydrolase (FSH1)
MSSLVHNFHVASLYSGVLNISYPVFIDAPHVLVPADLPGHSLEWLQAAESVAMTKGDSSLTPRAWWKSNSEKSVCIGLEQSLLFLRDILREATFQVRGEPLMPMNGLKN